MNTQLTNFGKIGMKDFRTAMAENSQERLSKLKGRRFRDTYSSSKQNKITISFSMYTNNADDFDMKEIGEIMTRVFGGEWYVAPGIESVARSIGGIPILRIVGEMREYLN